MSVSEREKKLKSSGIEALDLYYLSKSFDGLFWGILSFYILLMSTFQDFVFSTFPYLCILPLVILNRAAMKMPINLKIDAKWDSNITQIKVFSLIALFNFPFLIFAVKSGINKYYAICILVGFYAILQVLILLTKISHSLGSFYEDSSIARESKISTSLLYISSLTAIIYLLLVTARPDIIAKLNVLGRAEIFVKVAILAVIVFPLLLPVTLLFRVKTLISHNIKDKIRKK